LSLMIRRWLEHERLRRTSMDERKCCYWEAAD